MRQLLTGATAAALLAPQAPAQPADSLATYFGFDEQRIIVSDEDCGPVVRADLDDDGRPDLIIVNNRKSRIELCYLRSSPRSDAEIERAYRVNELPPNRWYDIEHVSVPRRVGGVRIHDADGDGKRDIIYSASDPQEIVVLRQETPDRFEELTTRRVRGLEATGVALEIADVRDDEDAELIAIVDGRVAVFPLSSSGDIGSASMISSGGQIRAVFVEDLDGNGLTDLLAVAPNDAAPLRLWLQERTGGGGSKRGVLAPELRFEMPALIEAEPIRFPDRSAASVAVIEQNSRRFVLYDLVGQAIERGRSGSLSERDARAEVVAFPDGDARDRVVALADLNHDGLTDLLAPNEDANTILYYPQRPALGLTSPESFPTFKEPVAVRAGQWSGDERPEVFVLSEEEKTVGVAEFDAGTGRVGLPMPLPLMTAGATPVAIDYVTLDNAPAVAVVVRDRRDLTLEIHRPAGESYAIELEDVSKPPRAIRAADANRDGATDLLLFTPDEPLLMLLADRESAKPTRLLDDDEMPQFGLVQAAGPGNTVLLDVDGDGYDELLIADANFVRACSYDDEAGWRVVDQINAPDADASFSGLTVLDGTIVAADESGGTLVFIASDERGLWTVDRRLRLRGFTLSSVRAGAFSGDREPGLLCVADDAFAIVRLAGTQHALEPFATYRSDDENRFEHEIEAGDINADGYVDLVALDAREQMCMIFTLSESRRLHFATEFKVFESRLFTRGDEREFEPSAALVGELTADGADDLALVVHDRVIIYPQQTEPDR